MPKCIHHPHRQTNYICFKYDMAMCEECLTCRDPELYCKHRSACPVWFEYKEKIREKRRQEENSTSFCQPSTSGRK